MTAIPKTFLFDCGRCEANDIKQPNEPVLKYLLNGRGGGASVQCCNVCVREIEREEKAEREKKEAVAAAVQAERAKIRAEEESRAASAGIDTAGADQAPVL
jgi:hypothetical protein